MSHESLNKIFISMSNQAEQYTMYMNQAQNCGLKGIEILCRKKHSQFIRSLKKITRIIARDLMIDEMIKK